MKRRRVFSKRNSHIDVPLDWLDTNNWFMDAWQTGAWRYIHVHGRKDHPEDGAYDISTSVFRVYPRLKDGETVRLAMQDGELYWLIDGAKQ